MKAKEKVLARGWAEKTKNGKLKYYAFTGHLVMDKKPINADDTWVRVKVVEVER